MLKHGEITNEVLNSFYEVYNTLGYGFLEKVYEESLLYELKLKGLNTDAQRAIDVSYKNIVVGKYYADIVVENKVIIEIKATQGIIDNHSYQLINYLKATDIEVGLLLNFGFKPSFERKIYSNKFST